MKELTDRFPHLDPAGPTGGWAIFARRFLASKAGIPYLAGATTDTRVQELLSLTATGTPADLDEAVTRFINELHDSASCSYSDQEYWEDLGYAGVASRINVILEYLPALETDPSEAVVAGFVVALTGGGEGMYEEGLAPEYARDAEETAIWDSVADAWAGQ